MRARLTNGGEVIRDSTDADSTAGETQVSEDFEGGSGIMIDSESIRIGGTEIPMSVVLASLVIIDIAVSAGIILND